MSPKRRRSSSQQSLQVTWTGLNANVTSFLELTGLTKPTMLRAASNDITLSNYKMLGEAPTVAIYDKTHGVDTFLDKKKASAVFNLIMDNPGTDATEASIKGMKVLNNHLVQYVLAMGQEREAAKQVRDLFQDHMDNLDEIRLTAYKASHEIVSTAKAHKAVKKSTDPEVQRMKIQMARDEMKAMCEEDANDQIAQMKEDYEQMKLQYEAKLAKKEHENASVRRQLDQTSTELAQATSRRRN